MLDDEAIRAFLTEGTRTGMIGYTALDGRPLVVPVWFALEGDELVFTTGRDSAKGRSIARDPRISLCVDLPRPPYAYVQVQGEAWTSADPDQLWRAATLVAARYVGLERAEKVGRYSTGPGQMAVRLRPTKVNANLNVTGQSTAG